MTATVMDGKAALAEILVDLTGRVYGGAGTGGVGSATAGSRFSI